MRKSIDAGFDDHPEDADDDEERVPAAWAVAVLDDCDGCADVRIELLLEEAGRPGTAVTAHLAPASARRLREVLAGALREVGEPV